MNFEFHSNFITYFHWENSFFFFWHSLLLPVTLRPTLARRQIQDKWKLFLIQRSSLVIDFYLLEKSVASVGKSTKNTTKFSCTISKPKNDVAVGRPCRTYLIRQRVLYVSINPYLYWCVHPSSFDFIHLPFRPPKSQPRMKVRCTSTCALYRVPFEDELGSTSNESRGRREERRDGSGGIIEEGEGCGALQESIGRSIGHCPCFLPVRNLFCMKLWHLLSGSKTE